jgi:signal transduction histidine kinase
VIPSCVLDLQGSTITGVTSRVSGPAQRRSKVRLRDAATDRRRVAREVHDGLAQELAFIASQAQRLDRTGGDAAIVRHIQAAAQRALLEVRLTIELLRAPDDAPLELLVKRAVASFEARFRVAVDLDLAGAPGVDAERRTAFLRILGQALANAVQHGGASRVVVRLRACEEGVTLRVEDNGRGFDASRTASGWGLTGMRERAELLGGRFSISSRPGLGAAVEVVLP